VNGGAPQEYLREVLSLNPFDESADVVSMRAAFVGLQRERRAIPPARDDLVAALEQLGSELLDLEPEEYAEQRAAIDTRAFPDLERRAQRLDQVQGARGEYEAALAEGSCISGLTHILGRILVASPSSAAAQRADFSSTLVDKDQRRSMLEAVATIEQKYPRLFALEREWFEHMRSQPRADRGRSYARAYACLFLLYAASKLVRALGVGADS